MLAHTFTATLVGLEPIKIEVEVDGTRGTPQFVLVGLTSQATDEAKERITSALQNCGFRIRSKRTVVNLAPADLPKTSAAFDLAIAVGILKMYQEIDVETHDVLFLGELALDGRVKSVRGALPLLLKARNLGFRAAVFPEQNAAEIPRQLTGLALHPIRHLHQYLDFAIREKPLPIFIASAKTSPATVSSSPRLEDIKGQDQAKRALIIAAAGHHHILMTGSPGCGKTLLAQTLPDLLPPPTPTECIEVQTIASLCGRGEKSELRPFRAPHHTVSRTTLLGNAQTFFPGEITLAHRGVLFLDELAEFPTAILDSLRQPLEAHSITFLRKGHTATFPADFLLVAATNPCPCGHRFSPLRKCRCSPPLIERYARKLTGPLLDRFDLRLTLNDVPRSSLTTPNTSQLTTEKAQQLILTALRHRQLRGIPLALDLEALHQLCPQTPAAKKLLHHAIESYQLSVRSYVKVWRISQTIADLAETSLIQEEHVAEALQYR